VDGSFSGEDLFVRDGAPEVSVFGQQHVIDLLLLLELLPDELASGGLLLGALAKGEELIEDERELVAELARLSLAFGEERSHVIEGRPRRGRRGSGRDRRVLYAL